MGATSTPLAKLPPAQLGTWRRRLMLWGLAAALLIGLAWISGTVSWTFHQFISSALNHRNYDRAEQLVEWTRTLRCANAETDFWEARLCRKQLRISVVPDLMLRAEAGGFDSTRLYRESVLLSSQTGQVESVVEVLNEMMIDPGDDGAEICEAYVNGALIAGANDHALRIIQVWKLEFPNDPQAHYAHARLLEYETDQDGAIAELEQAISKSNRHWPSRYALGRLRYDRNQIELAQQQFEVASRMARNAAPQYQLARCLIATSQPDAAQKILRALVDRDDIEVQQSFADVGEPVSGLPIHRELASVEMALNNHAEALHWAEVVLAADAQDIDARYLRALALRALGRSDEAASDFEEVARVRSLLDEVDRLVDEIQRHPDELHIDARLRIGEIYIRNANRKQGEFWLRGLLNLSPGYGPAHALLADYYASLAKESPEYANLAAKHRALAATEDSSDTEAGQIP